MWRLAVAEVDVYVWIIGSAWLAAARPPGVVLDRNWISRPPARAGKPRLECFTLGEHAQEPKNLFLDHDHRQHAFRDRLIDSGLTKATVTTLDKLETMLVIGGVTADTLGGRAGGAGANIH
jgi:hypothetical protein